MHSLCVYFYSSFIRLSLVSMIRGRRPLYSALMTSSSSQTPLPIGFNCVSKTRADCSPPYARAIPVSIKRIPESHLTTNPLRCGVLKGKRKSIRNAAATRQDSFDNAHCPMTMCRTNNESLASFACSQTESSSEVA